MPSRSTSTARRLRRDATPAEKKLWERLRRERLSGLKFRRQHPIGGRIADFACAEAKLAIELDGGVHDRPDLADREVERMLVIEAKGWRILRFRNREVIEEIDRVLATILSEARREPSELE